MKKLCSHTNYHILLQVLFALSVNNFNAVFSRISGRLQELSVANEEQSDHTDIELIQHINLDISRSTNPSIIHQLINQSINLYAWTQTVFYALNIKIRVICLYIIFLKFGLNILILEIFPRHLWPDYYGMSYYFLKCYIFCKLQMSYCEVYT